MEGPQWIGAREQKEFADDAASGAVVAAVFYLSFGFWLSEGNWPLALVYALLARWFVWYCIKVPVYELYFLWWRLRWPKDSQLAREYAEWKQERWRL